MTADEAALVLEDLEATRAFARRLAALLAPGDLVLLEGALGAGKSELVRSVLRALMGEDLDVPSPTFTLAQLYDGPDFPLVHVDCYRLSDPEEWAELGVEETLARGAALVEWPDRAGDALPRGGLWLGLDDVAGRPDARRLRVHAGDDAWRARLERLAPGDGDA